MYNNYKEHLYIIFIVTPAISICLSITLQISRAKPGNPREGRRQGGRKGDRKGWREEGIAKGMEGKRKEERE